MVTTELKNRIRLAMLEARENFGGSEAKFSTSLGISGAQYSRIKTGEIERILSDANWLSIARRLGIELSNDAGWKVAKTPVYEFITTQLDACQELSTSYLLCDVPDIGKTFTAQMYVRSHKNAVYIDCAFVKSKQRLVRRIAKEFGVNSTGKYYDVFEDLAFYLKSIASPLVILDEAGDLDYPAFLELKALWNATEHSCGWYMMGADGLKDKIQRSIEHNKVGYTEIFSRYGSKYGKATPEGQQEIDKLKRMQAALVIKANAPEADIQAMLAKTQGSLRRIYTEIKKKNRTA